MHNARGQFVRHLLKAGSFEHNLSRLIISFAITLIFLLGPQTTQSQESPITAAVNKTVLPTDELVILTVVVADDSAQQPRPLLPRLDGLAVIDLDISTSVDIVNGKIHTEVTYVYRLQPRRTGLLTIPPVAVKIDEQMYKTPPISINVTQGTAPAPSPGNEIHPIDIAPPQELQGQDFFVESQVNLLSPYVGQQIIHTFRFYQAIHLYQQPQYEAPLFTGFETMGLPVREYNLDAAERTYLVTEIRTALFPRNLGINTIRPTRLMLLGNFYEEPVDMYTEPITIEVKSLPDGAPADFNGAIGQYEIKAWISPKVAIVHQPTTLFVAISGIGNIHTIPEPVWPDLESWRGYNTPSSLTTDTQENGLINGTRVFERLIVPDQVGDFIFAPVAFVYFDPAAAEYRTITTEPLTVQVIPQPTPAPLAPTAITVLPTATPVSMLADATTSAPAEDKVNRTFLDSPDFSSRLVLPLFLMLMVGMCVIIPIAAVAGAGGLWLWQRRQTGSEEEEVDSLQQPGQQIHPTLAMAMQNNDDNHKAVNRALIAYLEVILQTPVTGFTRTELANHLRDCGLDEALITRIRNCLAQSEMGRYGPVTEDAGWSLMVETDELLFELDKVIGEI